MADADQPKTPDAIQIATASLVNAIASKQVKAATAAIPDSTCFEVAMRPNIRGQLVRGEPTTARPTVSLLSKPTMAELCRRLGATKSAFHKAFRELAQEVMIEKAIVGKELIDRNEALLMVIHEVEREVLDQLPPLERRGPLKFDGKAEFVDLVIK